MAQSPAPFFEQPIAAPKSAAAGSRVLYERFEIQKVLGKGSYGTAYKGKRLSDGKTYAIKEADVHKMTAEERADAVNEIRLLASIKHDNICRYHEAFMDGDRYLCIVMEFAPNGDLSRFIRKGQEHKRAFPEDLIWKYLTEVCLGLYVLHTNRILHRDIKAANIFVGENDCIKLGDLGIAKLAKSEGMAAQTQIGTPHYMPPELWYNKPYGPPADVWAVGCLLYELMAYRVPFEGESMHDLRDKIVKCEYRSITPGKYSPELVALMQSMLVLNPTKRATLIRVFQDPRVQAKLAKLPQSQLGFLPPAVMATIRVPADLRQLDALLPAADYSVAMETT